MLIDVLLGSYNGEKYIEEQIRSILSQSITNIRLIIRDDGSVDETVSIIKNLAQEDERIKFIQDSYGSLGVGENFKILLKHTNADYVLFSDQDDIWLPNKIEVLLNFAQIHFIKSKPSLVYSRGRIVDQDLNRTEFVTDSKLSISRLGDMMISNGGVQGCAMLFNRKMAFESLKYDIEWYMHDQVITLIAVTLGNIFYIEDELFLYRQHADNVKGYHGKSILGSLKKIFFGNVSYVLEEKSYLLFREYFLYYGKFMNSKDYIIMNDFLTCNVRSKFSMLNFIFKHKIRLSRSIFRAIIKVIFSRKVFTK